MALYEVRVERAPSVQIYKPDYFPRSFRYLRDAQRVIEAIAQYGGVANWTRVKRVRRAREGLDGGGS